MDSKESKLLKTLDDGGVGVGVGVDRISRLPDGVLCHILSFLPTKFAAQTSVLSTRWEKLTASLLNIDLDDSLFVNPKRRLNYEMANKFKQFVYRLFLFRNGSEIHRFRIVCNLRYDRAIINDWMSFLVSRGVRELDVSLMIDSYARIPCRIFRCQSLVVLKLDGQFVFDVPKSATLPNLKVMHLRSVKFAGDESVKRLFLGCLVLEDLSLFKCRFQKMKSLEISISSLKILTIWSCFGDHSVVLDTPNLETINYSRVGVGIGVCVIKNAKSIVTADMDCGLTEQLLDEIQSLNDRSRYGPCTQQMIKHINDMSNVKSLCLSDISLTAIFFSRCPLAVFRNLTFMELGSSYMCGWLLLPNLLESSPSLEVLVFYEGLVDYSIGYNFGFEYRLPESPPACLSRCLKEIKFGEFEVLDCEFAILEYFLKNAKVLEKVTIGLEVFPKTTFCMLKKEMDGREESFKWVSPVFNRLSSAPKCSKTCQIVVTWKENERLCRRVIK